jgi:hypothetical protein
VCTPTLQIFSKFFQFFFSDKENPELLQFARGLPEQGMKQKL